MVAIFYLVSSSNEYFIFSALLIALNGFWINSPVDITKIIPGLALFYENQANSGASGPSNYSGPSGPSNFPGGSASASGLRTQPRGKGLERYIPEYQELELDFIIPGPGN